jgi:glutaminase
MDYSTILSEIHKEVKTLIGKGKVADYIPALARVNPEQFGMAVATLEGKEYSTGDVQTRFSIQSISKVYTLAHAFGIEGNKIWGRVGREPSGNPFNSLVQLEHEHGFPRNPFINAGAMVITDILLNNLENPYNEVLKFIRSLTENNTLEYDEEVAQSERQHGYRNAAVVNFLKSHNNIHSDVEEVLDLYFHHCSINMNTLELARSFLFLANHGILPGSRKKILTKSQAKRLNALMLTCGTYDEAGDFAFRVGLPGKSGVGGGIAAIIPGKLSVAVWCPALNEKGNSMAGLKALELFTTKTGISVF